MPEVPFLGVSGYLATLALSDGKNVSFYISLFWEVIILFLFVKDMFPALCLFQCFSCSHKSIGQEKSPYASGLCYFMCQLHFPKLIS